MLTLSPRIGVVALLFLSACGSRSAIGLPDGASKDAPQEDRDIAVRKDAPHWDTGGCGAGRTRCGGVCVNLLTDPDHCGSCSAACAGQSTCVGGSCVGSGGCTQIEAEDASRVKRYPAGEWTQTTCNCGGGGALAHYSGGSATLGFKTSGTRLSARYIEGPSYSKFKVEVDGFDVAYEDLWDKGFSFVEKTLVTNLPATSHSVVVTCAAPNCEFDYFTSCN